MKIWISMILWNLIIQNCYIFVIMHLMNSKSLRIQIQRLRTCLKYGIYRIGLNLKKSLWKSLRSILKNLRKKIISRKLLNFSPFLAEVNLHLWEPLWEVMSVKKLLKLLLVNTDPLISISTLTVLKFYLIYQKKKKIMRNS